MVIMMITMIIHQDIEVKCELLNDTTSYYKYKLCDEINYKWDITVITDRTVPINRLEIRPIDVLQETKTRCVWIVVF